jgi:putative PIN family toxin of toxin-antitoxin system
MIKAVLDTNVLVSSLLSPGPPAVIIDMVAGGKIMPIFNEFILTEYRDVLLRKKFGFTELQVARLINDIARTGIAVESDAPSKIIMAHEDDRKFFDAAVSSKAYLITGNIKHFPNRLFIVSPAKFLTTYNEL